MRAGSHCGGALRSLLAAGHMGSGLRIALATGGLHCGTATPPPVATGTWSRTRLHSGSVEGGGLNGKFSIAFRAPFDCSVLFVTCLFTRVFTSPSCGAGTTEVPRSRLAVQNAPQSQLASGRALVRASGAAWPRSRGSEPGRQPVPGIGGGPRALRGLPRALTGRT